jgi:hypothetical protein
MVVPLEPMLKYEEIRKLNPGLKRIPLFALLRPGCGIVAQLWRRPTPWFIPSGIRVSPFVFLVVVLVAIPYRSLTVNNQLIIKKVVRR